MYIKYDKYTIILKSIPSVFTKYCSSCFWFDVNCLVLDLKQGSEKYIDFIDMGVCVFKNV